MSTTKLVDDDDFFDDDIDAELDLGGALSPDKQREFGTRYLNKIGLVRDYEAEYRSQAAWCYSLYMAQQNLSGTHDVMRSEVKDALGKNDRKLNSANTGNIYNVFFSNVNTLNAITGLSIPKVSVTPRVNYFSEDMRRLTNLITDALEKIANYYVGLLPFNDFLRFKLDWLVTGRASLWISQKKIHFDDIKYQLEYVRWCDFVVDQRETWKEVGWAGRRLVFTVEEMKSFLGRENYDRLRKSEALKPIQYNQVYRDWDFGTSPNMGFDYYMPDHWVFCVWEVFDRNRKRHIFLTEQLKTRVLKMETSNYFPLTEPLLAMINGNNGIPKSELLTYSKKVGMVNDLMLKRYEMLRSINVKGIAPINFKETIEELVKKDGNYIVMSNATTLDKDPVKYIDNRPKTEVMQVLSEEEIRGKGDIAEDTGISDIMKNKEVPEESATATAHASYYAEIRLKHHREIFKHYMQDIYGKLVSVVAKSITPKMLREIAGINLPTEKEKFQKLSEINFQIMTLQMQMQMQMGQQQPQPQPQQSQPQQQPQGQPQQPQEAVDAGGFQGSPAEPAQAMAEAAPNASQPSDAGMTPGQPAQAGIQPNPQMQNTPLPPQLQELMTQHDQVLKAMTMEDVVNFLHKLENVDYVIEVSNDDIAWYESMERATANINYLNAFGQSINALLPLMQQNPSLSDLFKAILVQSFNSFALGRQQRDLVDDSLDKLVDEIKMKAQNPEPTPDQIQLQIKKQEADARVLEAQARMKEAEVRMAEVNLKMQIEPQKFMADVENKKEINQIKMAGIQTKAQTDMAKANKGNGGSNFEVEMMKLRAEAAKNAQQHNNAIEIEKIKQEAADKRFYEQLAKDERLAREKMLADDNRYAEKTKSDRAKAAAEMEMENRKLTLQALKV